MTEQQALANVPGLPLVSREQHPDDLALMLSQNPDFFNFLHNVCNLSERLNNCYKDIHFHQGLPRHAGLKLFAATEQDGQVVLEAIDQFQDLVDCNFVVLSSDLDAYNASNMIVAPNIKIVVKSRSLQAPPIIEFWSGGVYYLSDGYSVRACANIDRTILMELGAV